MIKNENLLMYYDTFLLLIIFIYLFKIIKLNK